MDPVWLLMCYLQYHPTWANENMPYVVPNPHPESGIEGKEIMLKKNMSVFSLNIYIIIKNVYILPAPHPDTMGVKCRWIRGGGLSS